MTYEEFKTFYCKVYVQYPSLLEWINSIAKTRESLEEYYRCWYGYLEDCELAECEKVLDNFKKCKTSPFRGYRNEQFALVVRSCVMGLRMRQYRDSKLVGQGFGQGQASSTDANLTRLRRGIRAAVGRQQPWKVNELVDEYLKSLPYDPRTRQRDRSQDYRLPDNEIQK